MNVRLVGLYSLYWYFFVFLIILILPAAYYSWFVIMILYCITAFVIYTVDNYKDGPFSFWEYKENNKSYQQFLFAERYTLFLFSVVLVSFLSLYFLYSHTNFLFFWFISPIFMAVSKRNFFSCLKILPKIFQIKCKIFYNLILILSCIASCDSVETENVTFLVIFLILFGRLYNSRWSITNRLKKIWTKTIYFLQKVINYILNVWPILIILLLILIWLKYSLLYALGIIETDFTWPLLFLLPLFPIFSLILWLFFILTLAPLIITYEFFVAIVQAIIIILLMSVIIDFIYMQTKKRRLTSK
jgi:hypothetical protein